MTENKTMNKDEEVKTSELGDAQTEPNEAPRVPARMVRQPKPPAGVGPHKGFQSEEAYAAANRPDEEEEDEDKQFDGEITGTSREVPKLKRAFDPEKKVAVRSRTDIRPFTFGKKTYQIKANQTTLIPICVRAHLEEKGLL
jgi:hypothetical protein